MSWLGSLFTGENPTLNKNIGLFGQEAGFDTGIGQGDVTKASQWYSDILSGDPTKEAEAIAPETSALQTEGQQKKNELAEFSPRSGGTAAATSAIDTDTRAQIIKLLGGLKSGAAGSLAGIGENEQSLGLNTQEAQDQASQQRLKNWQDSILGQGTSTAFGYGEGMALDKIGGGNSGSGNGGNDGWGIDYGVTPSPGGFDI